MSDGEKGKGVIIIGAGQGGGTVAATLRQSGYQDPITLIGDEPYLPYQRPPLSKAFLKTNIAADALKLRAANYYAENQITLRLNERVTAIDPKAKTVITEKGDALAYDTLVLATGSLNRKLPVPGAESRGVFELRGQADAEALRTALGGACRVAIVGAGYVGLEVAASARVLGRDVTVIERESRVLARVASRALSSFVEAYHRDRGVEILTDASVSAFVNGERGEVIGITLADGRVVECDMAVVGIGALPADGLARAAGLACDNGVVVDDEARTSDPSIYAIGDMTNRRIAMYGNRRFRLESIPNAQEQAKQVAAAMTGKAPPPAEIPWFWSEQFDLKMQMAGLESEFDDTVVRGRPEDGKFAFFHFKNGRVVAVESVNQPIEFITAKTFLTTDRRVDPAALANIEVPIKSDGIFSSNVDA